MKSHSKNKNIRSQAEQQHLNKLLQYESVPTLPPQTQTSLAAARLESHLQTTLRPHGARHLWMQLKP